MTTLREAACRAGISLQDTHVSNMQNAIEAGNGVLIEEQAALLRECRLAIDELIKKKPMIAGLICGSTTIGNLRASLYEYRPQGVFGVKK
jgi:hypothetical protein